MRRKESAAHLRLNGYGAEKRRFRASILEVNGYRPEKSRSNVHNVHFFIPFLNEWTSKCGIFMPHLASEETPESERVWGGLCNFIIEPKFDDAGSFHEGLACVAIEDELYFNNKWGYINKNGDLVIETKFDEANGFSEGLACVRIDGKYGFIDRTGNIFIETKFDEANGFSEGLACVKIDGKYGFIDRTGDFVVAPKFDKAFDFSEGFATVGMLNYYEEGNNNEDNNNNYYDEAKEGWDMIAGDAGFDTDDYDEDSLMEYLGMD